MWSLTWPPCYLVLKVSFILPLDLTSSNHLAWSGSEKVGERTSEYQIDIDGIMTVLQHEESAMRKPSGKDRLLTFNKKGQLVRVDNETNFSEYSYGYVWMPKHDPDEEFVYEHRIQMAYF